MLHVHVHFPSQIEQGGFLRVQLDGFGEIFDCLTCVVVHSVILGTVDVVFGLIWVESNGGVAVTDGFVILSQLEVKGGQEAVGFRVAGFDFYTFREEEESLVLVPCVHQAVAQQVLGFEVEGVDGMTVFEHWDCHKEIVAFDQLVCFRK